ncbi:hypothetical protein DPMN_023986 [Dreissena polymorpha]|uniref:Uncharacterized protein n=1 Tax=Dreissena polymorpha TaxID=45954 RepID=A0A9D4RB71_DREPO|nr:hypothetical protein DPMN_023986 [Dreissena polymorpha]
MALVSVAETVVAVASAAAVTVEVAAALKVAAATVLGRWRRGGAAGAVRRGWRDRGVGGGLGGGDCGHGCGVGAVAAVVATAGAVVGLEVCGGFEVHFQMLFCN